MPGLRRIHRATDKEDIIQQMLDSPTPIFREIWRLLLFAASIGVAQGRKEPLAKIEAGKGIDQSSFANCPAWIGLTYLITLVELGNTQDFSDSEDSEQSRISLFEEYANGGLAFVRETLQGATPTLTNILDLVLQFDTGDKSGSEVINIGL